MSSETRGCLPLNDRERRAQAFILAALSSASISVSLLTELRNELLEGEFGADLRRKICRDICGFIVQLRFGDSA